MSDISDYSAALVFGSDTGNTEEIGEKIVDALAERACPVEMINVNEASAEVLESFDFLIMGIPTWDFGGIQEDWEEFEDELADTDLSGKVIAIYGLGDQFGYADYFVDAMGWLYDRVKDKGVHVIGFWPNEGYEFSASKGLIDKKGTTFCGLVIDEDQQFELTDQRVATWIEQITTEIANL
ncbi:MAG: flavodoxin [Gammaproteobacteria bacterium]|nr:MAG: flavodoxin [Gammaproteobacteria bacterium]